MSNMHPDTIAALRARLLAEIAGDPAYGGLGASDLAARLNAPVIVAAAPVHRKVLISDVRGYLEAQMVMVRLEDWVQTAPLGDARDAARTFLRVTSDGGITYFNTDEPERRARVLGLFALLAAAGAGGLTQKHYDDIAAMTLAPAGPPQTAASRWQVVIDGISPPLAPDGHPGWAGPPNAATAELVEGLINGNG